MSDDLNNLDAHGVEYAPASQLDGVPKRALPKRIALIVIEIVLVIVIAGLLVATWLPAIIGANPDAPKGGPLP